MRSERAKRRKKIMANLFLLEEKEMKGEKIDPDSFKIIGDNLENVAVKARFDKNFKDRPGDEELLEEHYATAKENGIGKNTLQIRFYEEGWNIDKAISEPPRKNIGAEKAGITVDIYLREKDKGLSDGEISKNFNIGTTALYAFKKRNGIVKNMLSRKEDSK